MFPFSPCSKGAAKKKCKSCNKDFNGRLRVNGHHLKSGFCSSCFCRHIAGTQACKNPRISASPGQAVAVGGVFVREIPWCFQHVTCADQSEGVRQCNRIVKQANPTKFSFCDAHGCASPDCPAPKPAGHPCCADHRCSTPGCTAARAPRPFHHCAAHTCEATDCTLECDGAGPPGSAGRRCTMHRHCASDGCGRVCHRREDGRVSAYCGSHYCRFPGCAAARASTLLLLGGGGYGYGYGGHCLGDAAAEAAAHELMRADGGGASAERALGWGLFCPEHTCVWAGCGNARAAAPGAHGLLCAAHECVVQGCRQRRRAGDWCRDHLCDRRGCPRPMVPGGEGYCERHRRCDIVNCNEDRFAEGDRIDERCSRHNYVPCRWDRCDKRCIPDSSHCEDHVCAHRACISGRLAGGPIYCGAHKCASAGCDQLRRDPDSGAPPGGALPYCSDHGCHAAGCGAQAEGEGRFCAAHTCAARGCGAPGSVPAPPGHPALGGRAAAAGLVLCERHFGDGYGARGGGWMGGPVPPWIRGPGGGGGGGGGFGDFMDGIFGRGGGGGGGGGDGGGPPWHGGGPWAQRGFHIICDDPLPGDLGF